MKKSLMKIVCIQTFKKRETEKEAAEWEYSIDAMLKYQEKKEEEVKDEVKVEIEVPKEEIKQKEEIDTTVEDILLNKTLLACYELQLLCLKPKSMQIMIQQRL